MKTIHFSLLKELVALECKLHDPETRKNPDLLESLLGQNFFEFGSSGKIITRKEVLESLPIEKLRKIIATDFEAVQLAENVVLLTYKTNITSPSGKSTHALRSSIWNKRKSNWEMTFHQATPFS